MIMHLWDYKGNQIDLNFLRTLCGLHVHPMYTCFSLEQATCDACLLMFMVPDNE